MRAPAAAAQLDALRILARHGGVVEVRMLKTPKGTVSGYFDRLETVIEAIARWDGKANIYVTANPVNDALLARAHNRLREFARETTADADILRRVWFLLDCDPARPAGISATSNEVDAALTRRNEIVAFLGDLDFPEPVTVMSGNGGHAIWACDLPNDEPTRQLFERGLKALGARFSDQAVSVDEAVFNAARIWKVPGTLSVKGDPMPDRPHRRAGLERVPAEIHLLDREALERLATMAPVGRTHSVPPGAGPRVGERFDLVGVFQARGLYKRPLDRGRHAVVCLWQSEHSGESGLTETCLFEPRGDGEPWGYDCKHSHCAARTIKDVLAVLDLSANGHHREAPEESAEGPAAPYLFTPAVSAGHFLADYIHYASARTDAPHEYHEAAGLILLAAATRGVKARLRQYPHGLGTNVFMLLLGPSTTWRKSTAKDIALDIYDAVIPNGALADLTSPEGFIEQMQKRSGEPATWFVDEMGDLVDKLHHAKYMAGLKGALLQLYDGRDYRYARHSKRAKGGHREEDEDLVRDPHLSVMGLATEALFDGLTSSDLTTGLLIRFAIVAPARKPPRRGFDEAPPQLADQRTALARRLHEVFAWSLAGPPTVVFAPESLARLDRFAARGEQQAANLEERQRAMLQRLDAMTIKLSMLCAAGRPDATIQDQLVVTPVDVQAALTIASRWRQDAVAFAARIGETEFERNLQRCWRLLAARKEIDRRAVARAVNLEKKVLDAVEATLVDRGHITVEQVREHRRGWAKTVWKKEKS